MSQWVAGHGRMVGSMAVLVPFFALVCLYAWFTRRDQVQFRPRDIIGGMAIGWVVGLVVIFTADPTSDVGHGACSTVGLVVGLSLAVASGDLRTRRQRRADAVSRTAALEAIPRAAVAAVNTRFSRALA